MFAPRNALGDLNSSTLNSRLNESDKPPVAVKGYNENPFRTKSRVERTPDFSAIKRRKSTASSGLTQTMEDQSKIDCRAEEASLSTSTSPNQALSNEMSTINIFKGFALSNEEVRADEQENLVGIANDSFHDVRPISAAKDKIPIVTNDVDIPDQIIEITESSNNDAMDDSTYDNDLNSVESELNQLNIDEVLQAFRDDAEAAEKAIEMATICGRLHPKEFREYLQAFRSPIKQCDEQLMKDELEWNYTRTLSARIMSGIDSATTLSALPEIVAFSSPKSSLLNMLEMADTPIEKITVRNNLAYSPILMSVECTPFAGSDDHWGTPLPKMEEDTVKGEASRHHSLKDRTETTRLAVAAAVASVSNIPFATPSYHDSTATECTQSENAIVPPAPKMIRISVHVPCIAEQLSIPESLIAQSPGKEEEGFLPRKVMMRTPPKCPEDTAVKVGPSEDVEGIAEDQTVEHSEGPCTDDSVLLESHPIDGEVHVDERKAALLANTSSLNESARNTSHYTAGLPEWSAVELDRVSRVIRRVSVDAADCPSTHSIMMQLKADIARLTREMSVQHSELAAVVSDKMALESRLEEVELETQKANKTIATLQASSDMRTAVHGQLQIDLELIAAKECLGRLADRKDAIAQRRILREARLHQIDAEVAAEIASLRMKKETRRESSRHRLLLLPQETVCDQMEDRMAPSNFVPNIFPSISFHHPPQPSTEYLAAQTSHFPVVSSPSNSSAHFKHFTQPLMPSSDCPFYAPRPLKNVFEGQSFLQTGTRTFSGFKSGAFNVVEKSIHPAAVDVRGIDNHMNNGAEEKADASYIVKTEIYDSGIDIGENIDDNICNTDNSIHGFDEGMDDIEYNEADGRNTESGSGSDSMKEPFMMENHESHPSGSENEIENNNNNYNGEDENKENRAITLIAESNKDTPSEVLQVTQINKKKSDSIKVPRVINVNYYGNLKFVALKVKSARPRPLEEEDYGVSSQSLTDKDMDNDCHDDDEVQEDGRSKGMKVKRSEKEKEKEKEMKSVSNTEEKKRNVAKREKRSRSDSMTGDRDTEELEIVEGTTTSISSSSSSVISSTKPQEKSKEKKSVSRKSKKELKIKNIDQHDENKITDIIISDKNNTKENPSAVLPPPKEKVGEETVKQLYTEFPLTEMGPDPEQKKKNKRKNNINTKSVMSAVEVNTDSALQPIISIITDKSSKKNAKSKAFKKESTLQSAGGLDIKCPVAIPAEVEGVVPVNCPAKMSLNEVEKKEESSHTNCSVSYVPGVLQSVRNATPYALFCASRKAEMRQSTPSLSASEILKTSSAEWKALSTVDKEKWVGRSAAAGGAAGEGGGAEMGGANADVAKGIEERDCASESAGFVAVREGEGEEERGTATRETSVATSLTCETVTQIKPLEVESGRKSKGKKIPPPLISTILASNRKANEEEDRESSDSQYSSELYELSKSSSKSKKSKKETSLKKKITIQSTQQGSSSKFSYSTFEKEPEEGLFSASLSLSPVLPGPTSPTSPAVDSVTDLEFDILLPKGKKEKVSRKRKDQPVVSVSETSIPEPGPSSTGTRDEVNIAQKEQRQVTWSDMPPPAAKLKKSRTQNSSSGSSSSKPTILEGEVLENPFPLEPKVNARPPTDQAGDRGKVKPLGSSWSAAGPGPGSSSHLLNTSVSTVSSVFSTTSSVRSKSQFILPKLKKRM